MILGLLAASGSRPWLDQNNPKVWNTSRFTCGPSTSGETVTPTSAMALAAYYACIDVISGDASVFPINIKRRLGAKRSELANDAKPREYEILNVAPNANSTSITLRQHIVAQCLGWGNGFWELQRLGSGDAWECHPLQAANMTPKFTNGGSLYWEHKDRTGQKRRVENSDLIHLCGFTDNGYVGWPIAYYASESLGTSLAQQKYAGAFFGNGANVSGLLKHPGKLSPEAEKRILDSWKRAHTGDASKALKTGLLPEGMEFSQTSVNPRDAEMI